jgi:hypothetical protein
MMASAETEHHQLITHHDPARADWCAAECTCGEWSHEQVAGPDPASHLEQSVILAEREWRRHLPGRDRT